MKAGVGLAGARMAGIDNVQATLAEAAARTTTSATPNGAVRFEESDVGDIKLLTNRMEERFLLERACGESIKAVKVRVGQAFARAYARPCFLRTIRWAIQPIFRESSHGD